MSKPAFFFDRDGVVNCDPHPEPYVLSWDQWDWATGAHELIRDLASDFTLVLVTSQKGVGKGLMSAETLAGIHQRMQQELGDSPFSAIYAFTGQSTDSNLPKPNPQMLHRAAEELDLDLESSWLIGDADRDIEMARRANVGNTIRVKGLKEITVPADHTVNSLQEVLKLVSESKKAGQPHTK